MHNSNPSRFLPALLAVAAAIAPAGGAHAEAPAIAQSLCQNCHGQDGMAVMPGAANLAGQQHEYLREQLRAYRDGRRQSQHMNIIAKDLSDADIDALADWYSSFRVTVEPPQ